VIYKAFFVEHETLRTVCLTTDIPTLIDSQNLTEKAHSRYNMTLPTATEACSLFKWGQAESTLTLVVNGLLVAVNVAVVGKLVCPHG
jgi:hypothetical protein